MLHAIRQHPRLYGHRGGEVRGALTLSLTPVCPKLPFFEIPMAAAASTSPSPNTTGKNGIMSTRAVARLMGLTVTDLHSSAPSLSFKDANQSNSA